SKLTIRPPGLEQATMRKEQRDERDRSLRRQLRYGQVLLVLRAEADVRSSPRRRSFICSCSAYIPTTAAPLAGVRCSLFEPIARDTHRSTSASSTTMAACTGCTWNGEQSRVRMIRKTSCGSSASRWKSARQHVGRARRNGLL